MILKDVLPFIGELNIRDVLKGHIAEITDRLLQRGVNRMAKVVLSLIRQMFRFAVSRDLLDSDPTSLLSKKSIGGANVERDRVLDEDEIKELAKKLPTANVAETASLAIWLVLATCCRIGELLKTRWDHIDFERKCWRIPAQNSKNSRKHTVYLSSFAMSRFVKLKEITGSGEWCFPASRKDGYLCSKTVTKQITDRQRSDKGHILLKLVWLYSEQIDSSLKSMVAQELAMFEAGMKLEASRCQRIEAAKKERPWPTLDQWIRKKLKLKTEWTNEKLWAALPLSHDGDCIYQLTLRTTR